METSELSNAAQAALNDAMNAIRSEISSLERQATQITNENSDLNDKVKRLEQARTNISEAKQSYNEARSDTKKEVNKKRSWHGKTFTDADNLMYFLVQRDDLAYDDLDALEDALLADISRLKNTIDENDGLLERIWKKVNSLNYRLWELVN